MTSALWDAFFEPDNGPIVDFDLRIRARSYGQYATKGVGTVVVKRHGPGRQLQRVAGEIKERRDGPEVADG